MGVLHERFCDVAAPSAHAQGAAREHKSIGMVRRLFLLSTHANLGRPDVQIGRCPRRLHRGCRAVLSGCGLILTMLPPP